MANPKKVKRASVVVAQADDSDEASPEDNDDNSGDSSSSESEGSETADEIVNVDFEAFPPTSSDFHGIRKLLVQVFRNAHVDISDLTNHLIELDKVSVVLRQASDDEAMDDDDDDEEDEDVYGVAGILPLESGRLGVKAVKTFLLEQCKKSNPTHSKFQKLLEGGVVGLLISERFINIPPRVSLPLLESVFKDWKKLCKSHKNMSSITHLILICKQYVSDDGEIFANGEEELFVSLADYTFDYEVPQEGADTAIGGKWKKGDDVYKQTRKVLVIAIEKFPEMIRLIEANL